MKYKKGPRIEVIFDYKHEADHLRPGTVWVRVYQTRTRRKYVSTGVRVLPSEWSDSMRVIGREDAKQLNRQIEEQVEACMASLEDLATDESIMDAHMRIDRREASFLNWLEEEIGRSQLGKGTLSHHRSLLSKLEEYGQMRTWADINATNIMDFLAWVKESTRMVDGHVEPYILDQCTVHDYWKRLRKWLIIARNRRLIPAGSLLGIDVKRGTHKEREYLTDEEIERWRSVDLPTEHLRMARDRFTIQMGTGLSFADYMETDFTKHVVRGGYQTLSGQRIKTGHQFFLVLLPMAVDILERWGWQVPKISNTHYNEYLEQVAALAGIHKHVTSHVARHTYATYCLAHGVRIEAVQRTLGHTSIKTTQIYAKMVDQSVLDAFDKMR